MRYLFILSDSDETFKDLLFHHVEQYTVKLKEKNHRVGMVCTGTLS